MRVTFSGFSQVVFAATMIGLGLLGLVKDDFSVMWLPIPRSVPAHEVLLRVCDLITVVCGIGLILPHTAAAAARALLAYLLFWFLVFRVPGLFGPMSVDVYWSVCKTGVMLAAAWVLYIWLVRDRDLKHLPLGIGDMGLRIARALYGLSIIPFGLAHFQYVKHTADLVPGWLPFHVAWVYFTGSAFIAAGVAILTGVFARLAAAFSALQMGMFLLLVWVPVVSKGSASTFQWGETLVSFALLAAAWVVADSYRDIPWLAARIHEPQ